MEERNKYFNYNFTIMKKTFVTIIFLLWTILLFGQPEIKFDTTVFDHGQIIEGSGTVKGEFHFTNTGTEPLIIHRAHSTGGFVVVHTYPKEPILSGERGVIIFVTLLNTFTPYSNPNNLITKLQQLNGIIQSEANISLELGNLGCNLENTVDSIERWLAFSPLKRVILDHVSGDASPAITDGFKSIVIPLRIGWFEKWKTDLITMVPSAIAPVLESNINGIVADSNFIADGASNIGANETVFTQIKTVLETLNIEFNKTGNVSHPIMNTSEALWIKSLNNTDIANVSNFIVIGEENWVEDPGIGYNQSLILIDHSIGYINSITELSCLIHEINTWHKVKKADGNNYSGHPLYFDTHGGDRITGEFSEMQQILKNTNTVLGYFHNFSAIEGSDGPWLGLITTPHANILYLNYYLDKLLK